MYVIAVSTPERPDYWTFQDYELVDMLTMRDELRADGKNPLILSVPSFPGYDATSIFDTTEKHD